MKIGFAFPNEYLYVWLAVEVLAIFLVAYALRVLEARRRQRLEVFVSADLAPRLAPSYDASSRRPLTWLTVLGFISLGLAMAQPHWGESWEEVQRQSRDIMVCLDTSESMNAADLTPTRLEHAKQKIVSLLDAAPGDRFGLVAFSGAAALQCPLTLDHAYFKAVLDAVDTDTISREGTDIAAALQEAALALQQDGAKGASAASRAIVLVSDGEEVSGNVLEAAGEIAPVARVYVLGVGDPNGAEVLRPNWMGRYSAGSANERIHVSKLDENTLSQIALATSGRYVRSTPDEFDVGRLVEHMGGLAGHSAGSEVRFRLVNRYQWFLLAAIVCFACEGIWLIALPWIRRRRLAKAARLQGREEAHYA